MQLLTGPEAVAWRDRARGATLGSHLNIETDAELKVAPLRLRIDGSAPDVAGLAYMLAITGTPDYDEAKFPGAVLRLKRWEIWSESIDRAGHLLIDGIRSAALVRRSIDEAPAIEFERGEFLAAHSALLIPMLFQWDAEFTLANGNFSLDISHDGWVDAFTGVHTRRAALRERFAEWLVK